MDKNNFFPYNKDVPQEEINSFIEDMRNTPVWQPTDEEIEDMYNEYLERKEVSELLY